MSSKSDLSARHNPADANTNGVPYLVAAGTMQNMCVWSSIGAILMRFKTSRHTHTHDAGMHTHRLILNEYRARRRSFGKQTESFVYSTRCAVWLRRSSLTSSSSWRCAPAPTAVYVAATQRCEGLRRCRLYTYASYTSNVCCGDFLCVRYTVVCLEMETSFRRLPSLVLTQQTPTHTMHTHIYAELRIRLHFRKAQLTDHRCALLRSVFSIIAHHDKYAHISHLPRAFVRVWVWVPRGIDGGGYYDCSN